MGAPFNEVEQKVLMEEVLPVLVRRLLRCSCATSAECALAAQLFSATVDWLGSPCLGKYLGSATSGEALEAETKVLPPLLLQLHRRDAEQVPVTTRAEAVLDSLLTSFLMAAHKLLSAEAHDEQQHQAWRNLSTELTNG